MLRLPGRGRGGRGGRRGARRGGAGAHLAVIAEQRGRTRSAIVSRLLRMIPAREAIPEEEQLGWITARLETQS